MTTETATVKLFFDAEKTKLVLEGDPEARILAAAPGDEIPEGFKAPAGMKQAAKADDKAAAKAENKGSGVTVIVDPDVPAAARVAAKKPSGK